MKQYTSANFILRCISGAIVGLVFILSIFYFRSLFYVIFYLIAALMLLEWYDMTASSNIHLILGQIIIPIPIYSIIFISSIDEQGWVLMTYFSILWSVDVNAMIGGKLIGGKKLAPVISPNKTISGLICGVLSAVIVVNLLTLLPNYQLPSYINVQNPALSIYVAIIGALSQASDIFISVFKRRFRIKDTGTIIPGHGGVLDRFDSMILTAPILLLFCLVHL